MWTDESIESHSAMLSNTEQLVLRAITLGYDLDDALDFVWLYEPHVDLDYAKAFIESIKYPDKRVPLANK